MKKIAFALQVFSLMAVLPVYIIIEMNHNMVTSTGNHHLTEKNNLCKTRPADNSSATPWSESRVLHDTKQPTLLKKG